MDAKTRVKAKKALAAAHQLYGLLDELQRELGNKADFAGYLLARDVHDHVFGRKSTDDVLGKLNAISTMGEKDSQ